MKTQDISFEALQKLADDPSLFHVIGSLMPCRPGVKLFITKLEYEHFKPGTDTNDLYQFIISKWKEMVFCIVSIPIEKRHIAEDLAQELNMRLSDGIPIVMDSDGTEHFPMNSVRVKTLENSSNSEVYESYFQQFRMTEVEEAKIEEIYDRHYTWLHENFPEEFPSPTRPPGRPC